MRDTPDSRFWGEQMGVRKKEGTKDAVSLGELWRKGALEVMEKFQRLMIATG